MLKKIFTSLIISAVMLSMALPLVVLADVVPPTLPESCEVRVNVDTRLGTTGCVEGTCTYSDADDCGICCLLGTVLYITDWIFIVFMLIVIVLVLFGAFNIMTSAGTTEKVESGRNQIMFAAVGFGLSLLTRAIPAFVKFLIAPGA